MNHFNLDDHSSDNNVDDKLTQVINCLKIYSDNPLEIAHGSNRLQNILNEQYIAQSSYNDKYYHIDKGNDNPYPDSIYIKNQSKSRIKTIILTLQNSDIKQKPLEANVDTDIINLKEIDIHIKANDFTNIKDDKIKEQAVLKQHPNNSVIHNVAQPKTDRPVRMVTLSTNPKATTIATHFGKELYRIAQYNIPKIKKADDKNVKTTEYLKLYYNTFIHKDNDSKRNLFGNTNNINNSKSATYNIPSATITNIHHRALNMMFNPSITNDKGLPCNTNIISHEDTILSKQTSSTLFQKHKENNEKLTDSITLSNNMNAANESKILCLNKYIIQEKAVLKKNINNKVIDTVA